MIILAILTLKGYYFSIYAFVKRINLRNQYRNLSIYKIAKRSNNYIRCGKVVTSQRWYLIKALPYMK